MELCGEHQLINNYAGLYPIFVRMLSAKDMKGAKEILLLIRAKFETLMGKTSDPQKIIHCKRNLYSLYCLYYSIKDMHEIAIFNGMKYLEYDIRMSVFDAKAWVKASRGVFNSCFFLGMYKQSHYLIRCIQVMQERVKTSNDNQAYEKIDTYVKLFIIRQMLGLVHQEYCFYIDNLRETKDLRLVKIYERGYLPGPERRVPKEMLAVSQKLITLENLEVPDGDARLEKIPENALEAFKLFKEAKSGYREVMKNVKDMSDHNEMLPFISISLSNSQEMFRFREGFENVNLFTL